MFYQKHFPCFAAGKPRYTVPKNILYLKKRIFLKSFGKNKTIYRKIIYICIISVVFKDNTDKQSKQTNIYSRFIQQCLSEKCNNLFDSGQTIRLMNVLNKSAKSIIIGWVIPFIIIPYCHAQQERRTYVPAQPMELHFRFDRTLPDSGYMDNIHVFNALDSLFSSHDTVPQEISSIHILSFASPEGNTAYNEQLAERRAINIKNYLIRKFPHIDTCRIHTCPQGENWQGLRRLVDEKRHLPHRRQILYIIDNSNTGVQRKKALKLLESDSIHPHIRIRMLRSLRSAILQIAWEKTVRLPAYPGYLCLQDTVPNLFRNVEYPLPASMEIPDRFLPASGSRHPATHPLFALKTNLLFDVALIPNFEIEIPIGRHWSVNGEYMFPWWLLDGDKYCLEIMAGGLEVRYWPQLYRQRKRQDILTGHFVGLYAGGGKYDLQWKTNGYQGEFFIAAGFSYGYAHKLSRHLHLEFNIGIGLLRTDYRHYHARNNYQTLQWQENGRYTWFGPTKAKVSLIWLLARKQKTQEGGIK